MSSRTSHPETEPLLPHPDEAVGGLNDYASSTGEPAIENQGRPARNVIDDVLPETATTGRRIGWASAYILILSRVIGSGIFAMPGTILQNVGSPGLALVLWIVGALVAWMALSIDIEYGCMLPRSGGMKVYLEYTYRKPRLLASTVVAIYVVVLGFTATNCIVFAKYVLFATGAPESDLNVKLLAVGLMTAITIIHGVAYRTGVFIQNVLGWLKIALVLFMILTGLFVIIFGLGDATELSSSTDLRSANLFEGSEFAWNTLATALFKIGYSYGGLNNVNNVLNEVKNPIRVLKTVPPIALISSCLLYVLINVAYLAVVPLDEIKASRELIAALFFDRVFGDGFGNKFLPLAIALSAAGNVMVVTFSLSRVNQEVARSGLLPFSSVLSSSQPFGSPLGGLIVHYIPSVLVIVLPPSDSVYAFIAEVEGYGSQYFALAIGVGLLLLRWRKPDLHRPYKAWLPVVVLRITLCAALILAPLFPPRNGKILKDGVFYATYALVGLAVLSLSVVYWYIWTRWLPRLRGHRLVEVPDKLKDGTTITRLVHKPI